MLTTVAALATTLLAQQPVDKLTLELYQQRFVVRAGNDLIARVPLRDLPELPPAVMFRRDDNYAVWDERGLTARATKWSFTSTLAEFPTSTRFFSRDEIVRTLDLVKRGQRRLAATGISGAKRLGTKSYFLARWDDNSGKPWAEVLLSVDLSTPKPKPVFVGRFEGLSLGRATIDDKLMLRNDGLEVVTQKDLDWGVSHFNPQQETFTFRKLGERLTTFVMAGEKGFVVEETTFGPMLAAEVDLKSGDRSLIYQGRGSARFLDALEPKIVVATTPQGRVLFNGWNGAEITVEAGEEVRRAGKYVLCWSPGGSPRAARLFDPERWQQVASWREK